MDVKMKRVLVILIIFIVSCKHQGNENKPNNSKQKEIITEEKHETKIEISTMDTIKIVEQLQGKWKEAEYPYRTVAFVKSNVKFVEEGTERKPIFEKFEISANCRFDNNNIRDLKTSDIILSLPETKRCEKLKISNDTLTFSGFKPYTGKDYNIVYLKIK